MEEANEIAQSLHRYRLVVFSNFLTEVRAATAFEENLAAVLGDAQAGSVVIVLGGKSGPYPEVYRYIERLAKSAGFELNVDGIPVSSDETVVADQIYEEGVNVCRRLLELAPDEAQRNPDAQRVLSHFTSSREPAPSSQLWAFRKSR